MILVFLRFSFTLVSVGAVCGASSTAAAGCTVVVVDSTTEVAAGAGAWFTAGDGASGVAGVTVDLVWVVVVLV